MSKTKTVITKKEGSLSDKGFRELYWNEYAESKLLGYKIVQARYLTEIENENIGWNSRPVALLLKKGKKEFWAVPQSDDEGNDGGALAIGSNDIMPVL